MTLELDTSLFKLKENITINQIVFLTLLLNENQKYNQDVHEFLSRISEAEIKELIDNGFVSVTETADTKDYRITNKVKEFLAPSKALFDMFYEAYPIYVIRPDGTKGFLRANINKCRKEYNSIVGKSTAMHDHLMHCLQYEINDKMVTGKMGYMKTMWKWLVNREWESIEEQMNFAEKENNELNTIGYGNTIV